MSMKQEGAGQWTLRDPKLPREAVQLYNLFIHGEITRRDVMDGLQRFAVGGVTAAALLQALMPNYALGQQVSKTDERIKATYETIPSPAGNGGIKGYLVRPVSADTRLAATWPGYDQALKEANVPHEGYIYPGAVHGFNCDATPERYKAAADLAWQRTIDWFNKYVRA